MLRKTHTAGFTLVEMIVAVALFSIVMLLFVSALLSLVSANRKAQALQSVMNNLNIALDGMMRGARGSVDYKCDNGTDCPNGGLKLAFKTSGGVQSVYEFKDGTLEKDGFSIIAQEVQIDVAESKFYVVGTTPGSLGNFQQPKVIVVIKGNVGAVKSKERSTFHIQATAVQRALDL